MSFQRGGGRKNSLPASRSDAERRLQQLANIGQGVSQPDSRKRQDLDEEANLDYDYGDTADIPLPSVATGSYDTSTTDNPLQSVAATRTSSRQSHDRTLKLKEVLAGLERSRESTNPHGNNPRVVAPTKSKRGGQKTPAKLSDQVSPNDDSELTDTDDSHPFGDIFEGINAEELVLSEDVVNSLLRNEVINSVGYLELSKAHLEAYAKRKNGAIVISRICSWINDSDITVAYRTINKIANRELVAQGIQNVLDPNLPDVCRKLFDKFCMDIEIDTFTASVEHSSIKYSVEVKTISRDALETIVYRVVNNAASGLGLTGLTRSSCGSGNDISQSECYKDIDDWKTKKFPQYPDLRIAGYRLFTDGCSLGTSHGDSMQPVTIDLSPSYPRSLRGSSSLYAQLNPLLTWFPDYRAQPVKVKESGKSARWVNFKDLPDVVEQALARKFRQTYYESVLEDLSRAFHGKVFDLPHNIGKVIFVFLGMKGDQPEMFRWTNALGCHICTNEKIIIIDDRHYRSLKRQGRIHEDGWRVLSLNAIFSDNFCDSWILFRTTDLMHTCDNAIGTHLIRLVSLIIGMGMTEPFQTHVAGKPTSESDESDESDEEKDTEQKVVKKKEKGVPKRVKTAQNKAPWKSFVQSAENIGGVQTTRFLTGKGSMSDRTYGLAGYVIALFKECEIHPENPKLGEILELSCHLYSIFTLLTDSCPGFVKDTLNKRCERAHILWSELNSFVGITDIPVSLHVFFHLPKLVEYWGPALFFALYRDESHHKYFKDVVLNLTNRQKGRTQIEFLGQVLRREARRDILQYSTDKSRVVTLSREPVSEVSSSSSGHASSNTLGPDSKFSLACVLSSNLHKGPHDIQTRYLPITHSESKLKKWGILARTIELEMIEVEENDQFFRKCTLHVRNEISRQKEIYDVEFRSVGELDVQSSMRAIACAPEESSEYLKELASARPESCDRPSCFGCASLELSSSLLVNLAEKSCLQDIYYIPLGFKRNRSMVSMIGLRLNTKRRIHNVIYVVSLAKAPELEEIDLSRLRGTCLIHPFTKENSKDLLVIERFKGSFF